MSCHCLSWPRIAPNASPPTATNATNAPSQSKLPEAPSALVSGMWRIVANRAIATSGMLIRNAARQLTVSTSRPPTTGPIRLVARGRRCPDPERSSAGLAFEQGGQDGERPRHEQRAGRALEEPEQHQQLEGGREAAQDARDAEPGEADGEDPAPAVVVGQGAGQDEQRGEDREVARDGVRLTLEHRDGGRVRQLPADRRQREVHHGAVEEHDGRAEDGREHRPALGLGHVASACMCGECRSGRGRRPPVGAAAGLGSSTRPRTRPCSRLPPMPGPVALVGAGEFLAPMAEFDRSLLAATGRARPRVVILPTAAAPDGEATLPRLGRDGRRALRVAGRRGGARARARRRGGARRGRPPGDRRGGPRLPVRRPPGVPGGRPARLAARGGADRGARPRRGRRRAARPARWRSSGTRWPSGVSRSSGCRCPSRCAGPRGSRSSRGSRCCPHYDAWPEPFSALIALQAPRGAIVLGIDEDTAAVGRDGAWQVHGAGRVTVWRGRHRERFRRGEVFRLSGAVVGARARPRVGVDLPEAVRAVDGLVHARLERHLRLVAARGADGREVLARPVGPRCARSRAARRSPRRRSLPPSRVDRRYARQLRTAWGPRRTPSGRSTPGPRPSG